ncbi:MAG: hypothetical protein V3S51_04285, partial [Dehalococcoidia bacterium]
MRQKRFLAAFVLCSVSGMLLGTATTYAQGPSPAVISSYTITDVGGSDVTEGPLMSAATYTVSLEINIGFDLPDTRLSLSTAMDKVGDVYWSLTNDFPGIDTATWQPGLATIEFDAVSGTAQFTVKGSVPSDFTTELLSNNDYLRFTESISLVELSLAPDGALLDDLPVEVVDQDILDYRDMLDEKQSLLQNTAPDLTYAALASDVITFAENLSSKGYVEYASDLLNALPESAEDFPTIEEYEQAVSEKNNLLQSVTTYPEYEQLVQRMIALS